LNNRQPEEKERGDLERGKISSPFQAEFWGLGQSPNKVGRFTCQTLLFSISKN